MLLSSRDSPGETTEVGCHEHLQGVFPTQESNAGDCRWILYCLSHQGSPRILEWTASPFSRGTSWPTKWTWASWIAGRFFTVWVTRKAHMHIYYICKVVCVCVCVCVHILNNKLLNVYTYIHYNTQYLSIVYILYGKYVVYYRYCINKNLNS